MFSPLDILYIVLAFCALWLTAAIFWLLWQMASMLRNVNETMNEGKEVMHKVESALSGIQSKFETATSSLGVVVQLAAKGMEYIVDKRLEKGKKSRKVAK